MKKFLILFILTILSTTLFAEYHSTKEEFENKDIKKYQNYTNGIYITPEKTYEDWAIKQNHTLLWKGEDYMPCGMVVCFKSLEDPENTTLLQEDINILNQLSANNIKDIIITSNNQLTLSNPKVLNEIISYLEKNNFAYGIDLNEESVTPLKGFIVNPNKYRIDGPNTETTIVSMWPEVDSGIYVIVNKITGEVTEKNPISKNNNGQVIIKLKRTLKANECLLVFPHVSYFNNFDLWQGYNEIRDNILKYFKEVNLGKGFRFFLDPFNLDKLTNVTDEKDFIPNSNGFNLTFENYLIKAYGHKGSVTNSWALEMKGNSINDMQDFMKMFPMWYGVRGVPHMYSLVTGDFIDVNSTYSTYWFDINYAKVYSLQNQIQSISTCLRDNIANVPVIFSASNPGDTFSVSFNTYTCDGFASYSNKFDDDDVNDMALLYTFSDNAPQTNVLFNINNKKNLTDEDINFLSCSGYRGFYFDYSPTNISSIKKLKEKVSDFTPTGISYPEVLPLKPQLIDGDTLWYPSKDKFSVKRYNKTIFAYQKEGTTNAVFFTLEGKRKITIVGKDEKDCKILYPKNAKIKKGRNVLRSHEYTFEIGETPVMVSNVNIATVCPKESAKEMIDMYESFTKNDTFEKPFVKLMKENLKKLNEVYKNGAYLNAYGMTEEFVEKFLYLVHADVWLEAENTSMNTFNKVIVDKNASQHEKLVLDTQEDPKFGNYYYSTNVAIPENNSYILWLAISKEEISSPISVSYDNGPWQPIIYRETYPAGGDMLWVRGTNLNFTAGKHTIDIKVTGMNKNLKYYLELDAIYLTASDSKPNGITKPKYVLTN